MAFARDVYTASAAQTDFTITFPYIAEGHVQVSIDGTLIDNDADADTSSYTIVSTTTVRIGAGLAGGETVVITRNTSQSTRLVDYASASTLTEEDLDNDSLQAFYMAQEGIDAAATALGLDSSDLWDAESKRITLVADPTAVQDAATKNYVDTVLTTLGNIPVPGASKDLLVATGATAGDYAWVAALDTATQIADDLIDSQHYAAASIDNEHLADDAVGLQEMAAGTAGNLITYDASGNPAAVATGTAAQVLTSNGAGAAPTFQALATGTAGVTLDTEQATTSGTSKTFTAPAGKSIYKFEVYFDDVSTSGTTDEIMLQIGPSGGVETSGYDSVSGFPGVDASEFLTTAFQLSNDQAAAEGMIGRVSCELMDGSSTWILTGILWPGGAVNSRNIDVGVKTITGNLNKVLVGLTGTPTDAFDAGSVNVRWYWT
jgi:hypothetical protein